MTRFIAIVWNERAAHAEADAAALIARACEVRPEWSRRWERPGLLVLEAPHRSSADAGLEAGGTALFLGALFSGARMAQSADIDVAALRQSEGARAFADLWGRYVLILVDEENACTYIARDPSGALPCYMAQRGWAFAFFSHGQDIEAIALERREIDWTYVAERLAHNRQTGVRTALQDVQELAPGALARVGQGRRQVRQIWRPETFAARSFKGSASEARHLLREAVEKSCSAWAGAFARVGLRLSGGLDSSIVLAALRGRTDIYAVNYATQSAEGDERHYARAAASFAGIELYEAMRDPYSVDLEAATQIAPTLNPPLWLADGESDRLDAHFAETHNLCVFFSGRGGDNVFFRSFGPEILADRLRAHGPGPSFWRQCWSHAARSGLSIAQAAHAALRLAWAAPISAHAPPHYMSAKAREMLDARSEADAVKALAKLPPGKRLHLFMLADRLNYFEARPHADYVYPLAAQPVLETVLALPTFVLAPHGADRGLARAAFERGIAPAILNRRSKGKTNAYLARILLRERYFLARFLLDGALEANAMIDGDALRSMLSEESLLRRPETMAPLVGLLSVEAWLRSLARAATASAH